MKNSVLVFRMIIQVFFLHFLHFLHLMFRIRRNNSDLGNNWFLEFLQVKT